MDSITDEQTEGGGPSRRDVLRRSAILGGALVWTVPTVQTIAGAAFATGTTCDGRVSGTVNDGPCTAIQFEPTPACCACLEANPLFVFAILNCFGNPCTPAGAAPC